ARGEAGNFASFLRVSALRYEAMLAHQRIPMDRDVPMRSLDPRFVLRELPAGWGRSAGQDAGTSAPKAQSAAVSSSARACASAKSSAPL
ncbi:MAG: hypothetical protein OEV65_08370, partial [Aquincola sp.]|nr:hypothetical protein [Aquincola sp.]